MASNFGSFNRSPFGAFIKSPLGARGSAAQGDFIKVTAADASQYISETGALWTAVTNVILRTSLLILPSARLLCSNGYVDAPYSSSGSSYTNFPSNPSLKFWRFASGRILTFNQNGVLYYSDNDGAAWSTTAIPDPSTGPLSGTVGIRFWTISNDGLTVYLICYNSTGTASNRRLYVCSTTDGVTLTAGPAMGTTFPDSAVRCSIWCEGNTPFIARSNNVYSHDGGLAFNTVARSVGSNILENYDGWQNETGYVLQDRSFAYRVNTSGFSVSNGTLVNTYTGHMVDANKKMYALLSADAKPYVSDDYINFTLLENAVLGSLGGRISRKGQMVK